MGPKGQGAPPNNGAPCFVHCFQQVQNRLEVVVRAVVEGHFLGKAVGPHPGAGQNPPLFIQKPDLRRVAPSQVGGHPLVLVPVKVLHQGLHRLPVLDAQQRAPLLHLVTQLYSRHLLGVDGKQPFSIPQKGKAEEHPPPPPGTRSRCPPVFSCLPAAALSSSPFRRLIST